MDEKTFKERMKKFGVNIIRMTENLPKSRTADILARQIIRSATSVGANYRAACRAKSTPDMINKLKIVEEETDETIYWLEILQETSPLPEISTLSKEGNELLTMTVASSRLSGCESNQIRNSEIAFVHATTLLPRNTQWARCRKSKIVNLKFSGVA